MKEDIATAKAQSFNLAVAKVFSLAALYLAFVLLPAAWPIQAGIVVLFVGCRVRYLNRVILQARTSMLRAAADLLHVIQAQRAQKEVNQ